MSLLPSKALRRSIRSTCAAFAVVQVAFVAPVNAQTEAKPSASTELEARTNAADYSAIVQRFGPAVVGVTVEGVRRVAQDSEDPRSDQTEPEIPDFLRRFFRGQPGVPPNAPVPPGAQPQRGFGSGFIIGEDGLILTNAHVVRNAESVTVRLSDRREFQAKVLGSDAVTDVAVLRIDAKGLPVVRIGNPTKLRVGAPVLAIGAPFGFEQTATAGIVSAKGRSLPGDSVVPFIQTDAAVNPGNSGGPLFDDAGNVVGINSQIYSRTGGYQGLAFAIPIDVALKVKDQIVETGRAEHARLGVTVQDLTQQLADSFGLSRPDGALVSSVAPGSGAARSGLKAGDVVTEVNGEPIVRSGELSSRIGLAKPGDQVTLVVWRDGQQRDIKATLGSAESGTQQRAAATQRGEGSGKLGLALRPLAPEEQREAGTPRGLIVEQSSGPAARAGIQSGDLLLSINGTAVTSVDQVRQMIEKNPKSVALLIERDGNRLFVPVPIG